MDLLSPHRPPPSTVRRNPPRRAKQTPSIHALISSKSSMPAATAADGSVGITAFPLDELLLPNPLQIQCPPDPKHSKSNGDVSNNLKVFLRIRPLEVGGETGVPRKGKVSKEAAGKNRGCLCVNSSTSVTLNAPPLAPESKRAKSEVYDGFSCVFPPESIQEDIYDKVMQSMVMDFMEGQSSLLVAMGPTGSGKTYTMFGSLQQLGIVPLALRKIFSHKNEHGNIQATRTYYLSMFEIYSVRGKGEKIFDLSPEYIDLPHQQSSINNLKEVQISNVADAEKIVAYGMHKRSTAPTNANNHSSRSHCVINIRSVLKSNNDDHSLSNSTLTIADLAGAERERKTGNQGTRLMESNFINNTSMVFGLCLRSLLEHQKNPKKPIEKHFKNSLLTRYLQDYMEGKKRMTLILTVKAGKVDYMDTSFVLRQASPYMKIKFKHLQENTNVQCQKRNATSTRTEKSKRRKVNISEASLIDGDDVVMDSATRSQLSEKGSNGRTSNVKQDNEEFHIELQKAKRSEEVMKNFARALLSMLKQYKHKIKESEKEVQFLKESLWEQSAHATELGKELKELRCSCSCLNNPPVEECAKPLPLDHCDAVSPLPANQDCLQNDDALPDENYASLIPESSEKAEIDQDAQALDENLLDTIITGDVSELSLPFQQNTLQQVEVSSGAYSGLSSEENAKEQSYQYLDENPERPQNSTQTGMQLEGIDGVVVDMSNIPSLLGEACISQLDGNEGATLMQARKIPETSEKDEIDQGSQALDDNLLDTNISGDVSELSLSFQQNTLQQVEVSSGAYSGLSLEENAKEQSYQYLDENPERFLKSTQTGVQLGGIDDVVVDMSNIGSLLGSHDNVSVNKYEFSEKTSKPSYCLPRSCDPFEREGCISQLDGNEVATLMQAGKEKQEVVVLPDNVQQNGTSNGTALKSEADDSALRPLNSKRPKRKLLPASGMLLKDFNGLDMDENAKEVKGKTNAYAKGRSEGSISLIRILRSNLPR